MSMANKTKQHASNKGIACTNSAAKRQYISFPSWRDCRVYSIISIPSILMAGHIVYLWTGNSKDEAPDSPHVQTIKEL